ncbi:NADH:flavin oxidoreductase/NADH oxidase [Granulosicoccus sp. 3-233]|uniref:NADH:flavin oxidoreductase/NADH oxidase n=1 Tax=Granulosicoccus sp. 3-233 TaxID=3417969 RepID=UPI003D33C4F1
MTHLFQPLQLRELTLKNRVIVSPMCQYSAVDGIVQDWHIVHLGQLAQSSAGMLVLEATAVEEAGRITHGCLGLYNDAQEARLTELVALLRNVNPRVKLPVCIQLGHAGRKGSSHKPWETGMQIPLNEGGWVAKAPSSIEHHEGELPPEALSVAEMAVLKEKFVSSVERSHRAGIDAIELHCAHGYLMHQFLSPVANQRTDEYGGSLENRMRYPLEVFRAMRAAWPADKPMGVRISASDWDPASSWDIQESSRFSQLLEEAGCDWVDVSSAGVSRHQKIDIGPGYQVHFAHAIKSVVEIPVMAVGMISEPEQAEAILAEGKADMIAIARAFMYNPRWVWHAAARLGATVDAPVQYWRSSPAEVGRLFGDAPIGQR